MKKNLLIIVSMLAFLPANAQRWTLADDSIVWDVASSEVLPHEDHLEMAGERVACLLRWGVDDDRAFVSEKSLIFPGLRVIPNNTYGSLRCRFDNDIPSLLSVNGLTLKHERVQQVRINGMVEVTSLWTVHDVHLGLTKRKWYPDPSVEVTRIIYPSPSQPVFYEKFTLRNAGDGKITVNIPEFSSVYRTDPAKGVDNVVYVLRCDLSGSGLYILEAGESVDFSVAYQAYPEGSDMAESDADRELDARMDFVEKDMGENLVLETPDPVIDKMFHFGKVRASESIFATKGGYMHSPGGEIYYAGIWANDQGEYTYPLFPFTGYELGNEAALNTFRHFARFMNDEYKPLPCSIIAEGVDIWDGAGDRGDAAMLAHGATRYALARADKAEAEELWPLIEWCLEYCRRNLNDEGVVISDTDELEGRAYVGKTNLNTSILYYDALATASYVAKELGVKNTYMKQAKVLADNIKAYFTAEVSGYETYRYYEGNTTLRSWICMPLIVGFTERAEGTVDALLGPGLRMDDGMLTEEGDEVFWDRSTLYAVRGIYYAGYPDRATEFLHYFSERRLLGDHVPYAVEAYPENSQVHLSAESALYCRALTEGLFGITPTGFKSFTMKPALPSAWDRMSLRNVRAFGCRFDIEVERIEGKRLTVTIKEDGKPAKIYKSLENKIMTVKL